MKKNVSCSSTMKDWKVGLTGIVVEVGDRLAGTPSIPFVPDAAVEALTLTSILGLGMMLTGDDVDAFNPSGSSLGVACI